VLLEVISEIMMKFLDNAEKDQQTKKMKKTPITEQNEEIKYFLFFCDKEFNLVVHSSIISNFKFVI
jgi:hypothetical protein